MNTFLLIILVLWGCWTIYTLYTRREYLKMVFRASFEQGKKGFRDKKR